ncbi:MAG: hypothetical protein BGO97_08140 [Micrococcales bacterium 70-64]|nr:hypothetical protein [Leifsonia sp.]ODU63999.1 MAG: hypothetical protein ABT06_08145 [Leifsonia sp. SCN 70-46]OJX85690.1 MAG: hypothetical protein BGO97_08140 [Micrococcales bacterium 70-64]
MKGLLLAGVIVTGAGVGLVVRSVQGYLAHPLAVSSTSGVRVFALPDGSLGGFEPFGLGLEPVVVGVGLVLVVGALLVGAYSSSRSLSSTSGENAEAHTA